MNRNTQKLEQLKNLNLTPDVSDLHNKLQMIRKIAPQKQSTTQHSPNNTQKLMKS